MSFYDLVVVGGGINGVSVARDAAGRGLKVLLAERDDLGAHTSSASSKLIHGGLRYLEQYDFRLVAEALAEREVLLRIAPHIIHPLEFVLPHEPHLRPVWMMRIGLFLYDHLGGRTSLPKSRTINLRESAYGRPLRPEFIRGFRYADAWVDDARFVVLTARDAADRGARVLTRTECVRAERDGEQWTIGLRASDGRIETIRSRALVNAAGPWAATFVEGVAKRRHTGRLKLVKGSHIVVPRLYTGEHAYILQNADKRVVFMIPYADGLTCIGTTDVPVDSPDAAISDDEVRYLCEAVSHYVLQPVRPADVVNAWSGVRALFDDGAAKASEVTRDYHLLLDDGGADAAPPILSIYGGKITTSRKLAEHVLSRLRGAFPNLGAPWTDTRHLPGGHLDGLDFAGLVRAYERRYPALDGRWLRALLRRHGSNASMILEGVRTPDDLGIDFGGGLFEREVRHLVTYEWARTADDILWRRTKAGLRASAADRDRLTHWLAGLPATVL